MRVCREASIRRFAITRETHVAGECAPARRRQRVWFLAITATLLALASAHAEVPQNTTRNTYGEIGLLDMPSAHVAPDGRIAFAIGDIQKTEHFTLDFQALPWLETSFRYSHVIPGQQNYDRSFSLKARLLSEADGLADVSVGSRDLLGTGIYSGEYLVVSKHVGPLDITGGMGWGRLSDTGELPNPLGYVFPSLKVRGAKSANTGGAFNYKQYFSGPRVGLFGGLSWQTPVDGLSVIAEYSSDRYIRERNEEPRSFAVRSPLNVGFSYDISDILTFSSGWYYGSTYGFTLTMSGDVKAQIPSSQRMGPAVPEMVVRNDEQQRAALAALSGRNGRKPYWTPPSETETTNINLRQALLSESEGVRDVEIHNTTLIIDARAGNNPQSQCAGYARIASGINTRATNIAMSDLGSGNGNVTFCPLKASASRSAAASQRNLERVLRGELQKQNLILHAVATAQGEIWVYYENRAYLKETEAVGRIVRVLTKTADSSIELFHLFPVAIGSPLREITVARGALERLSPESSSAAELAQAIGQAPAPMYNPVLSAASAKTYPTFSWGFAPRLANQLFDPDNPLQTAILADGSANLGLAPGLNFGLQVSTTLWTNYRFDRPADSVLPHVRTDLLKYLDQGSTGIAYLAASYVTRLAPDVFAEVKAGYLEDMYVGAGGQILWRPEGSRFAVGADLYQVWQRNYDRLFGNLPYNVLTGHVSLYYDSPWYGLNFAVHTGRYLAGDKGATFEIKRRFDSGIEIGAFATFTNVPFQTFGEGSFDKGIIVHIPMEWMLPFFTKSSYDLNLRPLTRDGGQRLAADDSLYEFTRDTSYNEVSRHLDDIVAP
jgi:hypothetical protein